VGLVLGAGGITGFAYHLGALSALGQLTGWDPRSADVIVGTSAGAVFGAVLRAGVAVDDVLAHAFGAPADPAAMAQLRVLSGREASAAGGGLWFGPSSPSLVGRELLRGLRFKLRPGRFGAALLPAGRITTSFIGDRLRALHGLGWPEAPFWACAVRLGDGRRIVFGSDDADLDRPVDVGSAVEASSAIPAFFRPVMIGGDRYVDGGVHSPTNADLLVETDLDLIVISSPMSARFVDAIRGVDGPARIRSAQLLGREMDLLRRDGRSLLVVQPDREEARAMGPFYMDPTRMVPTVTQVRASTLQRLGDLRFRLQLDILRRAATGAAPPAVADAPGRSDVGQAPPS
jgi:NTE family protein